jgi:hypothetical protein
LKLLTLSKMIGLTNEWIDAAARSPDELTGEEMEIAERIAEKSGLLEIGIC